MTDLTERKTRATKTNVVKDKNDSLKELIIEMMNNKSEGVVTYEDGKTYTKVDYRLRKLRQLFGYDVSIISNILERNSQEVCVETTIQIYIESRGGWQVVANGISHETRDNSVMHNNSYVEIAETSAIGRALANLGLFGSEYASVNEMEAAKNTTQQKNNKNIQSSSTKKVTAQQISRIKNFLKNSTDVKENVLLSDYKKDKIESLTFDEAESVLHKILQLENDDVL